MISVNKLSRSVDMSKSQKVHNLHTKYQLWPHLLSLHVKELASNPQTIIKSSVMMKALKAQVSDLTQTHIIQDTVFKKLKNSEETKSKNSYDAVMHTAHFLPLKQDTINNIESEVKWQQCVAFSSHILIFCSSFFNINTLNQFLQQITVFNSF